MVAVKTSCLCEMDLVEYAEGRLRAEEASAVEQHLAACGVCFDRYRSVSGHRIGLEIPSCHVMGEIGRGRFGIVYKAWYLQGPRRVVALKVLRCPGEMERSRFEREITVLKALRSPSIVKCLGAGKAGDAMYYVMEYVAGAHLDEHLVRCGEGLNAKLAVFERVCRAVADAHAQGVVHRDLKPRNILVDESGEPHILDFGVCGLEAPDWTSSVRETITHPGDVIGTLKYMSPEQAWGGNAGPIDERSDIWALGIMLYEIVTGGGYPYSLEPTRDKSAGEALLDRIRSKLPQMPRLSGVPRGRDLEVLLSRCLAWDRAYRMASASALANDIEGIRAGRRIRTRPLGLPYRVKRLAVGTAMHSRWTLFALLVACAGVLLWFGTLFLDAGWRVRGGWMNVSAARPVELRNEDFRDLILIVGVEDATVDAVPPFAATHGIPGVTREVTSWRGVHAALMERLAKARPRALVWDYYFRTAQPHDARFARAVLRLEAAGVPVTLAAATYRDNGTAELSPAITAPLGRRLRHGAIVARDMMERPGEFVSAVKKPDGHLIPSVSLTTLASLVHPEARLELEWPKRRDAVTLLYEVGPGAFRRERGRIAFSRVFQASRSEGPVQPGDVLGCHTFALDDAAAWPERTVAYQALLSLADEDLASLVGGKIVIVGDMRAPRWGFRGDWHRVRYGGRIGPRVQEVPGAFLLAESIAGVLRGEYVQMAFPLPPLTFLVLVGLSVAGCVLAIRMAAWHALAHRAVRGGLYTGVSVAIAVSLWHTASASSFAGVHGGMACFALLLPMPGALWVEFTRNRYRVSGPRRFGSADFAVTTRRTVTLPPPTKSLEGAG